MTETQDRVFRVFTESETLLYITRRELARKLDMPLSTVSRNVTQLVAQGWLCEVQGRLMIGLRVAQIAAALSRQYARLAETVEGKLTADDADGRG